MELSAAIEMILDGNAVLFAGAGFSKGAVNIKGYQLPMSKDLAVRFSKLCSLPENTPLEDASEAYAERFGIDELIREIKNEFTVKKVLQYHQDIAALPWKRIYTTNYDNVLERAYSLEKKVLTSVTSGSDIYKFPKSDTMCIHLNGYVGSLDRSTIYKELRLTEVSYLTASIKESPWAMLLRDDLRIAQSVIFLGYSLYDLDIKRLLLDTIEIKEKTFFIVGESPDEVTVQRASRFGTVVRQSVEQFSNIIKEIRKKYSPKEKPIVPTLAIKEYKASTKPVKISDKSFIDLLLFGKRTQELISESLRTGHRYFLERYYTNEVFDLIDRGHRIIVICSDLGNGKSLFLEGLRMRALEKGFRVFGVTEQVADVIAELEEVAKLSEKTLTTIEEYQNWLDEIRHFRMNANHNAVLVLTARNAINDVVIDDLTKISGTKENIPELNLDKLREEEIEWFIETFDTYGLWGTRAGRGRSIKFRFIERDCQRQIHAILLKQLSSPHIGEKIQRIARELREENSNYKVLLSALVLTLLNYNVTLDTLADIWGIEAVSSDQFKRSRLVKQFVDLGSGRILVRSSVVAEYLLSRAADASTIVGVLIKMMQRVHEGSKVSRTYDSIFKSLMRFSNIQLVLPAERKLKASISYYESIKNLARCKYNPLFWLQYAIASLVCEDIDRAEHYFDTAYSLAEHNRFDTFQIDNHFARFLLAKARNLTKEEAIKNFRQARDIINRQIYDERRHYPYRVATGYQAFFDRFANSLSPAEVEEIVSAAKRIIERIEQLPEERRHNRYIVDCTKAMYYVIRRGVSIASKKLK